MLQGPEPPTVQTTHLQPPVQVREPSVSSFIFERNRLAKIQRFEDVTSSQAYEHGSEFYSVAMDTDAYSRAEYLQFLKANTTTLARVQEVLLCKQGSLYMIFMSRNLGVSKYENIILQRIQN